MNLVLNRLVREGVITGFETNFDDRSHPGLHILVDAELTEGTGRLRQRMDRVRRTVRQELQGIADGATVSVRQRSA